MEFIESQLNIEIQTYRNSLYNEFVSPLDSMWQDLYIANSTTYIIQMESKSIGYCCIDDNKTLLQIYVISAKKKYMNTIVTEGIKQEKIKSAKLSSIEPIAFNVCIEFASELKKDTINYTHSGIIPESQTQLSLCTRDDISQIKEFYKSEIGFDDQIGYTENIVHRNELFCLRENDLLLGTGECRLSDTQPKYADLGIAVSKLNRSKGIGSSIMSELVHIAFQKDRTPICSTTVDNIGSQKAIENAGFYPSHIIFEMKF